MIDRRRSKRITVKLDAGRISGDETHAVFIENISEHGIYMITAPAEDAAEFAPGTMVRLQFQITEEERLNIDCRVIWSHKDSPDNLTSSVGMDVIDPPSGYKEFIRSLS